MYDINGNVTTSSPHVEIFFTQSIVHRSPIAATDDASKTMLGATQKAWLKARLLASTATFKIISSTKKTYKAASGDNGDTFGEYTTERNELLDYIASNGITGVIWIAGDKHYPHIISQSLAASDSYDHVCICACPIGVATNTATPISGAVKSGINAQVFGVLDIQEDYIQAYLYDSHNGSLYWTGKLNAGTNYLTYDTGGIGV